MAAPSDSSSDPIRTQSLGSSAAGAHAASDRTDTAAADRPATPDRTVAIDRVDQGGSNETTTAQPVVDRTPTTPVAPPPAAAPAREPEPGRGAPRIERQHVMAAQKARYGGISWGAAFFGWLSANGMAVILISLLSAAGLAFGLSNTVSSANQAANSATSGIGLSAGIALLVALFLAYLAGGYVAGRMSRFDGVKQGVAVWVIGLIVVLLLALAGLIFGSQYNVLSQLNLPRIPIDEGTATTAGIIALVAVLVATLLGAILGGILGTRFHRKVDRVGFDAV
jgi:hypothetical protein